MKWIAAALPLLLSLSPAWAAKPAWLPCEPDKLKFKPSITVAVEENTPAHAPSPRPKGEGEVYFLNTSEDETDDRRVNAAAKGEFVLGLQSLYLNETAQRKRRINLEDWSKARIFGLDHPYPGGLYSLMQAFSQIKIDNGDRNLDVKAAFLRTMADNPFLREAWIHTRQETPKIPNPKDEAIARIVDQFVNNPDIDQEKFLFALAEGHPWFERLPFLDIVAGVEKGYGWLVRKPEARAKYAMPAQIPEMMQRYFRLGANVERDVKPLEQAVARWRTLFMASSVSALVCKAAESSKNIVALVEPDLVKPLAELLRESFGASIKVEAVEPKPKPTASPSPQPSPSSSAEPGAAVTATPSPVL